jgi:SAM-dependent methyltransferase
MRNLIFLPFSKAVAWVHFICSVDPRRMCEEHDHDIDGDHGFHMISPEQYNAFPGVAESASLFVQRIQSVVTLTSSIVALDFGAGTGLVTLQLLPVVGKVYVLDPAEPMLDKFKSDVAKTSFRNFKVCNGTIADFAFPPLDIVACSLSLHHTPDIVDAVGKIFAALRPGGHLFIVENQMKCNIEQLIRRLMQVGFSDITSELHMTINVTLPDGTQAKSQNDFLAAVRPSE